MFEDKDTPSGMLLIGILASVIATIIGSFVIISTSNIILASIAGLAAVILGTFSATLLLVLY